MLRLSLPVRIISSSHTYVGNFPSNPQSAIRNPQCRERHPALHFTPLSQTPRRISYCTTSEGTAAWLRPLDSHHSDAIQSRHREPLTFRQALRSAILATAPRRVSQNAVPTRNPFDAHLSIGQTLGGGNCRGPSRGGSEHCR